MESRDYMQMIKKSCTVSNLHIVGVENVVSRFSDESYSGLLAPKKAVEESVIHSKSGQHPWLGSPYVTLKLN